MSYQVLARKWRPQRFDDVVGQTGVTRTLQNGIASGRIAQAFLFAGPRGVGKTTTARILARALNCRSGPTPEPCGTCDACTEIAAGRDMDVLEIDAATHTGVDKVRDVIISGLSIPPVRDRYRIFIMDEAHQLSGAASNALLKSIEEPPPHVVFMMATTELQKIPETIASRSQVHEFRTISERAIAAQLRKIASAEAIEAADDALSLVARAADGSMRDALTAFDQVLAFAGSTVTAEDVASVLGLVGRDLLLDILEAVASERAPAAFELAGRATESGCDLRMLCRDLSRLVRDLMLVLVDPARLNDTEVVPAGERDRVAELVRQFSREDLLRAFDLLARAESDLRNAAEPRYHLEMAILKWIHLRKLVPLADLIERLQQSGALPASAGRSAAGPTAPAGRPSGGATRPAPMARPAYPSRPAGTEGSTAPAPARGASAEGRSSASSRPAPARSAAPAPVSRPSPRSQAAAPSDAVFESDADDDESYGTADQAAGAGGLKDAFLAEIRRSKVGFYQMTVAQASRVDVERDRIVLTFAASHRLLKEQVEQNRGWLEPMAARLSGRGMKVVAVLADAAAADASAATSAALGSAAPNPTDQAGAAAAPVIAPDLKAELAQDPEMKTLLELIPLDIKDVEKM